MIEFEMEDGMAGRLQRNGDRWFGDAQHGNWRRYPPDEVRGLDDDIPF
ncbi:hypothetical protein [Falsiroseomonas tokyonensis]|uniref:Uncharacterized protein n=1 Tax=Falsiroseomonas tokyonensis TaxID=430521 RepID=A0ABV7C173_9PROT|nr:hypothetical protein [Falsiroseomonas tokyonensis]MBU8540814.1 hypothetical protein [Falsiroseomonas tokyonensis]